MTVSNRILLVLIAVNARLIVGVLGGDLRFDLVVVVENAGFLSESDLQYVKDALTTLYNYTIIDDDNVRVGVVQLSDEVRVLLELSGNHADYNDAVQKMTDATTSADLGVKAIEAAIKMLLSHTRDYSAKKIVLLTNRQCHNVELLFVDKRLNEMDVYVICTAAADGDENANTVPPKGLIPSNIRVYFNMEIESLRKHFQIMMKALITKECSKCLSQKRCEEECATKHPGASKSITPVTMSKQTSALNISTVVSSTTGNKTTNSSTGYSKMVSTKLTSSNWTRKSTERSNVTSFPPETSQPTDQSIKHISKTSVQHQTTELEIVTTSTTEIPCTEANCQFSREAAHMGNEENQKSIDGNIVSKKSDVLWPVVGGVLLAICIIAVGAVLVIMKRKRSKNERNQILNIEPKRNPLKSTNTLAKKNLSNDLSKSLQLSKSLDKSKTIKSCMTKNTSKSITQSTDETVQLSISDVINTTSKNLTTIKNRPKDAKQSKECTGKSQKKT